MKCTKSMKIVRRIKASSIPSSAPPNKQMKMDKFMPRSSAATQKQLDSAVVDFIVESGSAFRMVNLESFKMMLEIINPSVSIRGRNFCRKLISENANVTRQDIMDILEYIKGEVNSHAFTTDL